jgi:hypothetical protein
MESMEACPGFRNRNTKSEASLRGDRVHEALQKDKISELAEDERPIAQMCKDYIDAVITDKGLPDYDHRELTVTIDLGAEIKTFGTFDRLLTYETQGCLFDYKSGYRAISDAENNPQAWSYVIGTFQRFAHLDDIEFTFLCPIRDEVFTHSFTRGDLPSMILRLNTIVQRAKEIDWSKPDEVPAERLNPQPCLCEYCRFQTVCPALTRKMLIGAKRLGPGLPLPESMVINKDRPQDIANILRLAPIFEKWAEESRAEARRLVLEEGIEIPGFRKQVRKTDRAVSSVLGAWEAVQDAVELKTFLSICSSVSIPELEKLFKEKAKQGSKAKAARDMEIRLRKAGVWQTQGEITYLKEQKA